MPTPTFIAKNPDNEMLHAYWYTGSHFKRRCGTGGSKKLLQSGSQVSKVAASWFLKQSNACQKCKSTFDIGISRNNKKVSELQQIAQEIEKQ